MTKVHFYCQVPKAGIAVCGGYQLAAWADQKTLGVVREFFEVIYFDVDMPPHLVRNLTQASATVAKSLEKGDE